MNTEDLEWDEMRRGLLCVLFWPLSRAPQYLHQAKGEEISNLG